MLQQLIDWIESNSTQTFQSYQINLFWKEHNDPLFNLDFNETDPPHTLLIPRGGKKTKKKHFIFFMLLNKNKDVGPTMTELNFLHQFHQTNEIYGFGLEDMQVNTY